MFNKIIATATIRFIVTVAIVVYKGLTPVVYRMLTVKETLSVETETTEQMKSRLEAKRKENVGRPKKGEAAKIAKKSQEVRATFIVDADLLRKVKYISLVEGLLLKDVIAEALNAYVNKWEEVNRKIRLPKVK